MESKLEVLSRVRVAVVDDAGFYGTVAQSHLKRVHDQFARHSIHQSPAADSALESVIIDGKEGPALADLLLCDDCHQGLTGAAVFEVLGDEVVPHRVQLAPAARMRRGLNERS